MCPHCGYCPHCGRSNQPQFVPYNPYPYYGPYNPWYIPQTGYATTTTESPNITWIIF